MIIAKISETKTLLDPDRFRKCSIDHRYPPTPSNAHRGQPAPTSIASEQARKSNTQPWKVSNLLGTLVCSRRRRFNPQRTIADKGIRPAMLEETVVEYRGPSWLINRAWSIQAMQSCSGWTFSPRTYNTVPADAMVFRYGRDGNIEGLQELFDKRAASPFDRNDRGGTPLHEAATFGRYRATKLLISLGADVNCSVNDAGTLVTPLEKAANSLSLTDLIYAKEEGLETTRLLLQATDAEPDPSFFGAGHKEGFHLWMSHVDPLYYSRSLEDRFGVAMSIFTRNVVSDPELLWMVLDMSNTIPAWSIHMTNNDEETLLHRVAGCIGLSTIWMYRDSWEWFRPRQEGIDLEFGALRERLKELVKEGSHLHHVSKYARTPFLELLFTHIALSQAQPPFDQFLLRIWLEDLHEAGIDLEEYGKCEVELREQGKVCWFFPVDKTQIPWDFPMIETDLAWVLEKLVCGPSPNDWEIRFKRVDNYSADQSNYQIPGSWTEDDQIDADQEKWGSKREAYEEIEELEMGSVEGGLMEGEDGCQEPEKLIPGTERWREYSMMVYRERLDNGIAATREMRVTI